MISCCMVQDKRVRKNLKLKVELIEPIKSSLIMLIETVNIHLNEIILLLNVF